MTTSSFVNWGGRNETRRVGALPRVVDCKSFVFLLHLSNQWLTIHGSSEAPVPEVSSLSRRLVLGNFYHAVLGAAAALAEKGPGRGIIVITELTRLDETDALNETTDGPTDAADHSDLPV